MHIDLTEFDTQTYRRGRVGSVRGEFAWAEADVAARTVSERADWQDQFRRRFAEALGSLNAWEHPPLDAEVTDVRPMDGYRRETVTFTTRPGLRAFGLLLVPDDCPLGQPAVLCLPGHGRGIEEPGRYQAGRHTAAPVPSRRVCGRLRPAVCRERAE